jgi:hypothetical protein
LPGTLRGLTIAAASVPCTAASWAIALQQKTAVIERHSGQGIDEFQHFIDVTRNLHASPFFHHFA